MSVLHGISKWATCECAGVVQLAALPEESVGRSPPGSGWLPWNLAMVGAKQSDRIPVSPHLCPHCGILLSSSIECKEILLSN